jgi:hypothetical protein
MSDDQVSAELAAIAERVSASGAGGWWTDPNDGDIDEVTIWDGEGTPVAVARTACAPGDAIAAFITAARSYVPRLLKAVEAALDHHNREMAMNPATRILAAECARCCQPWPCREVRAITRELTGGTNE